MSLSFDALIFDVQGTLLDFYTPVRQALADALPDADPATLTLAWRRAYFTGMRRVTEEGRPFVPVFTIYREGLDAILDEAGLTARLAPPDRDRLTGTWTSLVPWPDTIAGLKRLRPHLLLVALTNGSMAGTIAMAARHDLAFHAILSTELVRTYKPAAAAYRLAIESLGLPPERLAMVASHPDDLAAARSHGLRGIFIDRPREFGPTPNQAVAPDGTEITAAGLQDLAGRLEL